MRPSWPPHAPVTLFRPPDPQNIPPSSLINNSTKGISKLQPTEASNIDLNLTDTVQIITSTSSSPVTTMSGQNLTNVNRAKQSLAQTTPTFKKLDQSTEPIETSKRIAISGDLVNGENGFPTSVPPPKDQHHQPTAPHPPKVSSNFDPPNQISQNSSKQTVTPPHPLPVRPNDTKRLSLVTQTVQQLNTKFNHQPIHPSSSVDHNKVNPPLPHAVKPSFANTLRSIHEKSLPRIEITPAKQTSKQGYPAIIFNRDDYMVKLASRCRYTLIGKFDSTMPKLETIRRSFELQVQLKGPVKITHFNSTHVYIDLSNQLDHDTVWFKEKIWIQGRPMKLFAWTPTFKPNQETPIAPIWVVLPELPWHMFYMEALSELLLSVGRAICLDTATFQKTRGSVAKVKLQIDVTKPRPKYLWVGFDEDENGDGFWQEVEYENVPQYCIHCKHQGHTISVCPVKKREDHMNNKTIQQEQPVQQAQFYQGHHAVPSEQTNRGRPQPPKLQYVAKIPSTKEQATVIDNIFEKTVAKRTGPKHDGGQPPVRPSSNLSPVALNHTLRGNGGIKENLSVELHCKNGFDALDDLEDLNLPICEPIQENAVDSAVRCNVKNSVSPLGQAKNPEEVNDQTVMGSTEQNLVGEVQNPVSHTELPEKEVQTCDTDNPVGSLSQSTIAATTGSTQPLQSSDINAGVQPGCSIAEKVGTIPRQQLTSKEEVHRLSNQTEHQTTFPKCTGEEIEDDCLVTQKNGDKSVAFDCENRSGAIDVSESRPNAGSVKDSVQSSHFAPSAHALHDVRQRSRNNSAKMGITGTIPMLHQCGKDDMDAVQPAKKATCGAITAGKVGVNGVDPTKQGILCVNTPETLIPGNLQIHDSVQRKENQTISTKDWVLKSFTPFDDAAVLCKKDQSRESITEHELPAERKFNSDLAIAVMTPQSNEKFVLSGTKSENVQTTEWHISSAPPSADTGQKKTKKKTGKNTGTVPTSPVMEKSGELPKVELQLTEEEVRKAKIRAWQDAILAKSYAANPVIENIKEPLNVLENKATYSVPSQDSFDPSNAITMGRDNDDIENDRALTAYVSPAHSGNRLIPTATLEVMCKQASKVMKEVGRGFFPVTPQDRIDTETQEAPTYYLGDFFEESQKDQKIFSKEVKSKWNLNAPLFIPNALRQHEPHVPVESVDSQDASAQEFPTGPSDEVLLQRMDLHDIRGLLHRQNSPPHDLPQKFSSPHPGIIEDGSEYEDEDEDSTAYNKMAEARYAGLSPRFEQACKPKLIKKKRRPLETKKKEAAPKKPKRVQPTRSSKSRSSRRK